ncbi:MAG: LPS export ABC transporter permease LptG [Casimicrobiaceae bacterium]|nr:LPS export ABC transporter permease LptG [Casimicrobiaceae bacterium]MCX8097821.1 LPS export ABC transporter permease LptG [Casimicrobiaceae bacterium]MDW8311389.1 LPS export ABC transporter permease LptG [Burkholderiales bacterium]
MSTLHRYIAREIFVATAFVLTALLMLWVFYEFLQDFPQLRALNTAQVLVLVASTLPHHVYELLPVSALIGTLFALAQLSANSEYAVMRTAGISVAQIARTVALCGFAIATLAFVVGEYVVPRTEQAAQRVRAWSGGKPTVARAFASGYWFRDGPTFINIGSVLPDGVLRGVRVFEFAEGNVLARMLIAESAQFVGGQQWQLAQVSETRFSEARAETRHYATQPWLTMLTPNMLSVLQVAPDKLPVSGLIEYAAHLKANQQDARRFEVALWGKFFYPLASCVLMLLAMPFAQIQPRSSGIGGRLFVGILIGLVFIILNRLFSYLTLIYAWPPFLGALMPGALFLALAAWLTWRLERR